MNAHELYKLGRIQEAIEAQTEEVKKSPNDVDKRGFLCELICFTGDLDRIDTHYDLISKQDPKSAVAITLNRQLLRAERARQQVFNEGRVPEFLGEPTPVLKMHLEATILIRTQRLDEAAKLTAQAEVERPKPSGTCDGQRFEDLRDADDLTASFFEVLTSTGKYYWIPIERVAHIEFHPPKRPLQLIWRPAQMIVNDGPDGVVYIPTLYPGSHAESDDQIRLGRATDWKGGNGSPIRGIGRRTYLVGDQDKDILAIGTIDFDEKPG